MTESKFNSQYGEDKILSDIFKKRDGFCIEIGGFDGITRSNSYYFERIGWDCIIIEPIPFYFDQIKKNRSCKAFNCAVSSESGESDFYIANEAEELSSLESDVSKIASKLDLQLETIRVQKRTFNSILEEANVAEIDFITIDVEGHEMEVLKGFDILKYRPAIMIIEDNSACLDTTIERYLKKFDYVLFKRTGCNDWYATRESFTAIYTKQDLDNVSRFKSKERFKLKMYFFLKNNSHPFLFNILRKIKSWVVQ